MSEILTSASSQHLVGPRDANGLPTPITLDESMKKLKSVLLKSIRRSAYVYRVDCGSCNGCEIEFFSTITPMFDAERFGIKLAPSPQHADILAFSGALTRATRVPALRAYNAAPDPKICISYGACGISGGIFHDLYCVWGGTDKIVPVDLYIPGCPPTPAAFIYGFALALGMLDQKLKKTHHDETGNPGDVKMQFPEFPQPLRVLIEQEARRMAGYRYGRQIADKFMQIVVQNGSENFNKALAAYLEKEEDPRLGDIMGHLTEVYEGAKRGDYRL
ncbi:NADH-quinone oxidoreductase subunit NuoB [Acetobacteraceae bacterium]|nr:NADH-quinone oxidoreductase subunit NuoB [Acetobacteraceae bacterium]